ncbi:bifunctional ornithine acetyltransferase/N-acetylglutamate synthase [Salicibibacter cibarius]|uniref:Arginine biosynthesis bifunctional protein ArgJ n=1 Tax=Salicibibacter cibarius TaxID=2743000 RepID=A0A7T6Z4Z7_9BACI|nr:bifunctional ornithine acetyltransferase/N-acetylglutamate synthase [Salicibibacter cibarius]QQK76990.1 bifunctional ornithine acetyltransferase/N-acetylglutamate synthase [Salicibibacter cibarius]
MASSTASCGQMHKITDGSVHTPLGFKATGLHTKVKRKRKDLGAIVCDVPASAAAVYTLNQIQAAPLDVTRESIAEEGTLRAVVVNSGQANAVMGKVGVADAYEMRDRTAQAFGLEPLDVAIASTGTIGERLQMEKILPGIEALHPEANPASANAFAESILTTDTCTKETCYATEINGKTVHIGAVAKGSGMIHPNMATMLSFVTTDAAIAPEHLQQALSEITDRTYNRITIDGDTSTNDMVLTLASGKAGNEPLHPEHPDWQPFIQALQCVAEEQSKQIARDGEGATKLVEVNVKGAPTDEDAGKIAKQIVGSDLLKTAVFGTDGNWGRIICAIGYSGVTINPETIDIAIGPHLTLSQSEPVNFSEEAVTAHLKQDEVFIDVELNIGDGSGKAWGCDLTYDYVRINAGYRT